MPEDLCLVVFPKRNLLLEVNLFWTVFLAEKNVNNYLTILTAAQRARAGISTYV